MIVKNGINCVMLLCNGREMAEQSLRLDGRKVCNIKMVGLSQAESNKATVCVVPSIHLPLTREARMWCRAKGWCGFERVWWCSNPSDSRPNFCGRQHLPLTRDGHGCPKLNARSFAGCKTNRAFIRQG